jgi:hypothetical protein
MPQYRLSNISIGVFFKRLQLWAADSAMSERRDEHC